MNCIITPKTIHTIPSPIMTMNIIRPQFFLFSRPIEEISVVEDTIRNATKKSRIFDIMNLKNAGMSSAPGAFEMSFTCEGLNIKPIIIFWAIDTKVEKPARAIKTHESAVTKLDLLVSESNFEFLSAHREGQRRCRLNRMRLR